MATQQPTHDGGSIDPRPRGGPASGHAAVGFVVGQRLPDGTRPEYVTITYRRGGEIRSATVLRDTVGQQVEDTPTGSVRFWIGSDGPLDQTLRVDEILAAEPVDPEECR